MTGPEHYECAIAVLDAVGREQVNRKSVTISDAIAAAQVHATLALAAAVALQAPGGESGGMHVADAEAWEKAVSAAARLGAGR